jgi:hypothetical protein
MGRHFRQDRLRFKNIENRFRALRAELIVQGMRNRPLLAGFVLGLAILKFQVVLGLLAVLALRRMWKVLAGSAIGASVMAGVSVLITGWRAAAHYPARL